MLEMYILMLGAWRVFENVFGVLQTRKTTKIACCFRQMHYNRDIQMALHCDPSFQLHFGRHLKRPRQGSSRQGKLKLSQTVQTLDGYRYPPKPPKRRASGSQNKVSQSCSRNVMFFIGFVTM